MTTVLYCAVGLYLLIGVGFALVMMGMVNQFTNNIEKETGAEFQTTGKVALVAVRKTVKLILFWLPMILVEFGKRTITPKPDIDIDELHVELSEAVRRRLEKERGE